MHGPTHKDVGALAQGVCQFVHDHPTLVEAFLSVLEYRTSTLGFPEHALTGESKAGKVVIETLLKDEPHETALEEAKKLPKSGPLDGLSSPELLEKTCRYARITFPTIVELSLLRQFVIDSFYRNQERASVDIVTYLAALHLEYVRRKEDTPY